MSDIVVNIAQNVDTFRIGNEGMIVAQPTTGFVSVSSFHHRELNGSHWWTARGRDMHLYTFVQDLYRDYAVGKLFGDLEEFDVDATRAAYREWIIDVRREGGMKRDKARDMWDEANDCETADDFCRLHVPDGWEMIKHRQKPCVDYFWQRIWTPWVDAVRPLIPVPA